MCQSGLDQKLKEFDLKIWNWLNGKDRENRFEIAFTDLKKLGESNDHAKRTFDLLKDLNDSMKDSVSDILVSELMKIRFASNTYTVFHFYFPLVSHILYYKPQYETRILGLLIGPAFADGVSETEEMIAMMQRAMDYKLSENRNHLTEESKNWIMNELPKMEKEVEREIRICWKELDE